MLNDDNNSFVPLEEIKDKKVFIATPCYGGMLFQEYVDAILNTTFQFIMQGMALEIYFAGNESLIPRARNHIVAEFMSTNATHLLFIDADIRFKPQDIFRLLQQNKNIVCGAYPLKT